jgi:hypothetical protein
MIQQGLSQPVGLVSINLLTGQSLLLKSEHYLVWCSGGAVLQQILD